MYKSQNVFVSKPTSVIALMLIYACVPVSVTAATNCLLQSINKQHKTTRYLTSDNTILPSIHGNTNTAKCCVPWCERNVLGFAVNLVEENISVSVNGGKWEIFTIRTEIFEKKVDIVMDTCGIVLLCGNFCSRHCLLTYYLFFVCPESTKYTNISRRQPLTCRNI